MRPPDDAPDVTPLPARRAGHVTFGCLNNASKITPYAVALWSRILRRVPGSVLCLKSVPLGDAGVRARCERLFARHGIPAERLRLLGGSPYADHLATYQQIDVCLDTFPYNGGATTLDSLWMGTPVVTLAGDRFVGRMGVSLLATAGLDDCVAHSPAAYVRAAVALAGDLDRLASLRASLRERIRRSPLCDGPGMARALEALYRQMWRAWSLP